MEGLDSTTGIVALAAAGVALVALAVGVAALIRLRKLRRAQRLVLGDRGDQDLVAHAAGIDSAFGRLDRDVRDALDQISERLAGAESRLDGTVSHTAVVRYDAFNETSGRQSSSIALLNEHGDGVVLSAILQREQARVYAKPVRRGDSELELSPEEREAIAVAMRSQGGAGEAGS